jgi:putative hydrolase of the HAD superfamily
MRYLIWDFDGTLATRIGGWGATLCEVIESEHPELSITAELVSPHLRTGFPWHAPDLVRTPGTADQWWDDMTPHFCQVIGAVTRFPREDALPLARRVRELYLHADRWLLYDDVLPTLGALRARGWRHIVLSNHAPELGAIVERLGLSPLIDAVYNSALTGKEKPNPAAFECVFADFPEARSGWMIGDNWVADVQGAKAVGVRSILVRRPHPEATNWCESLHDVIRVVEASDESGVTGRS